MSDKQELKLGHPLYKKADRKTPKPGYGIGYAAELHRLQSLADELAAALRKIQNVSHHKRAWEIATAALAKYDEAKT